MRTLSTSSILILLTLSCHAQMPAIIDDDIMQDPHFREEHGLNDYTRPSIDDIFQQLQQLAPLPVNDAPFLVPKRMPENRDTLAIQTGFLISEGFLAVQSGDMKKVQDLASTLSRYANAIGAGEKVKGHAAQILELSEQKQTDELKKELVKTQEYIEKELILLQDIDLAHLISLGGWLRALHVSSLAVEQNFNPQRARLIFREDIADYYEFALNSMKPELREKENIKLMLADLANLKKEMLLEAKQEPSPEKVKKIYTLSQSLVKQALNEP